MASSLANNYIYNALYGGPSFHSDTLKICLMANGFTFNKNTQNVWADVSASELAAGYGYLQNTKTLGAATITKDTGNSKSYSTYPDVVWTASGGSIGPTPGAIIYDSSVSNVIVGYVDFLANQTAVDGATLTKTGITFTLTLV